MKISKIGILSLATLLACTHVLFGLLAAAFFSVFSNVSPEIQTAMPIGEGALMWVFMPLAYGIFGFILGAISAIIYNIAAAITGGIAIEFNE